MNKRSLVAFICIAAIVLLQIPAVALADAAFTTFTNGITPPVVDGINVTIPSDPATDSTIRIDINMTTDQWKNAFAGYFREANISIPFVLQLPDTATHANYTGTSIETTDADAIRFLENGNYRELDPLSRTVKVLVDIAHVAYDGTTAVITPISLPHSFCLRWKDDSHTYYHRFDFAVTQQSTDACKIFAAAPELSRIVLQSGSGVTGSYSDGAITYSGGALGNDIETFIKSPAGATRLILNDQLLTLGSMGSDKGISLATRVTDRLATYAFSLQWKDDSGNTVKAECLSIVIVPTTQDKWLDSVADPVPESRMGLARGAQKETVTKHLSYSDDKGEWRFSADADYGFDPIALCGGEWIFRVTPTDAAVSVKIVSGTGSLFDAGFSTNVTNLLNDPNTEAISIADENSAYYTAGGALKFTLDGNILSKAALDGSDLTVYTVNTTMPGCGSWMVFQWLDESENPTTEFVYLVKEAFIKETESAVLQSEPDTPVADPTAVFTDNSLKLKTRTPLQNEVSENDWAYQLNDLKLVDSNGNEVKPTDNVDVYLPYPSGMNYNNANDYDLTLRHYNDATYTTYTDITLTPTPYGLKFETGSFSPFLLGWKLSSGGYSSSGYSAGMPSFTYPTEDTQVSAAAGTSAALSVSVSGAEPISCQWQINRGDGWKDIVGATNTKYSTSDVDVSNYGYQYRCVATNSYGTATSKAFTLTGAVNIPATGDMPSIAGWLIPGVIFLAALAAGTVKLKKHQR